MNTWTFVYGIYHVCMHFTMWKRAALNIAAYFPPSFFSSLLFFLIPDKRTCPTKMKLEYFIISTTLLEGIVCIFRDSLSLVCVVWWGTPARLFCTETSTEHNRSEIDQASQMLLEHDMFHYLERLYKCCRNTVYCTETFFEKFIKTAWHGGMKSLWLILQQISRTHRASSVL